MIIKLLIGILANLGVLYIGHAIAGRDWDQTSYWTGFIAALVLNFVYSIL